MAKLYFRYGTVGSAKTLNLLAVAFNYRQQQKKVILLKPSIDVRFGNEDISSRTGLKMKADFLVNDETRINYRVKFGPKNEIIDYENCIDLTKLGKISCIIVDEAQFLSNKMIEELLAVTIHEDIPVICYGLKTDFKGFLFEGSKRLLELADSIEEEKTTCAYCNKKATFNIKLLDGQPTSLGPIIDLGADEKYQPACKSCYHLMLTV